MEHLRFNLTNFFVIGLSAGVFLLSTTFVLIYLNNHSWPILSPAAHAVLAFTTQFPAA